MFRIISNWDLQNSYICNLFATILINLTETNIKEFSSEKVRINIYHGNELLLNNNDNIVSNRIINLITYVFA